MIIRSGRFELLCGCGPQDGDDAGVCKRGQVHMASLEQAVEITMITTKNIFTLLSV
jgi:hypothetical protein